jgi:hypothetical protein
MSQIVPISPAALAVDNENPRIADEGLAQREAMRAVAAEDEGKLLLSLAEDVVDQHQLDPSTLPIVIPSTDKPGRYIVLEGNRRLVAIRALENPDVFLGAVSNVILERLRKFSAAYQTNPVKEIQCCLMKDADEAQHWIDLRHTGPNGGAGLVAWNPTQKARFEFRTTGKLKIHVRLLDFLEHGGYVTKEERRLIPLSNFERLVKSPAVRQRIGMSVDKDGKLQFVNEETAVKGLLYIAHDLISGKKKVVDIYTADQRTDYANKMPTSAVPVPKLQPGSSLVVASMASLPTKTQRAPLLRLKRERERLIPTDSRLRIVDPRCRRIAKELQGLTVKEYANAVATLFRVFIELSADYFLVHTMKRPKTYLTTRGVTLSVKLNEIVAHLETQNLLSRQDAAPVKAACAKNSFLATSVVTMNEYVHNFLLSPSPVDLLAAWEGFEPFLQAIWP